MGQEVESRIDDEAVRRELERILSSSIFSTAKRSRMFLRYAVERSLANSAPKEFEIAVEVLERSADYDPDVDATVRVEASRLRHRLREYYDTVGKDDSILIDIPKGGYGAVFLSREAISPPHDSANPSLIQADSNGVALNGLLGSEPPSPRWTDCAERLVPLSGAHAFRKIPHHCRFRHSRHRRCRRHCAMALWSAAEGG